MSHPPDPREHQGLCHMMAHRFRGRGLEEEDLAQEANLALIRPAGHDPTRGIEFSTYPRDRSRELGRTILDTARMIRLTSTAVIQGEGDHWRRQPWDPGLHPTEETEPRAGPDPARGPRPPGRGPATSGRPGPGDHRAALRPRRRRTGESDTTIARSLGLSRAHVSYLRDRALRNCGG